MNRHGYTRIELGEEDQGSPWLRWLAFGVLLVTSALARVAGAVIFAVWPVAVWITVRVYAYGEELGTILHGWSGSPYIERIVRLDVSTCSLLIAGLVLWPLGSVWARLRGLYHDEGEDLWKHAHSGQPIYSESLATRILYLGLIGTLLVLVLRALAMVANKEGSAEVFLLLCASLVSTLIAAVASFVVLPIIEGLVNYAIGADRIPPSADTRQVVEEMHKQMRQWGESCSTAGDQMEQLQDRVKGLTENFEFVESLGNGLAELVGVVRENTQSQREFKGEVRYLARRMEGIEKRLDSIDRHLTEQHETLEARLSTIENLVEPLCETAKSMKAFPAAAEKAAKNLGNMATAFGKPMSKWESYLSVSTDLLSVLGAALKTLFGCELPDKSIAKLTQGLSRLTVRLESLETCAETLLNRPLPLVNGHAPAPGAAPPLLDEEKLSHLKTSLEELNQKLRAGEAQPSTDMEPILEQIQETEKSVESLTAQLRAANQQKRWWWPFS